MRKQIYNALKVVRSEGMTDSPIQRLHLFKIARRTRLGDIDRAHQDVLEQGLLTVAETDELAARIVRMHFFEGELVQNIAAKLSLAEGTVFNKQSSAITRLADCISELEDAAIANYRCALEGRLTPLAQSPLVGIDEHLEQLSTLICQSEAPWLFALAGMGGIGKTTLADALVRTVIRSDFFYDVGWVTAQQRTLTPSGPRDVEKPALTIDALLHQLIMQLMPDANIPDGATNDDLYGILCPLLQAQPCLIVIDNLETLTDVESLLSTLRTLTNPTKFLLTSRQSLYGEPDIYHFPVPELTGAFTLSLVRQEAQQRNLAHLVQASDGDLQPIVETVGGNPLAIRLVVGQTYVHTLDVILENLRAARGQSAENLYTYIYRQAWDALNETARRTLLVMPLISRVGGTIERIVKVSRLEESDVIEALETLVRLNLVDSRGGLNERRYTIHNLTTSFLHEQVIQWQ